MMVYTKGSASSTRQHLQAVYLHGFKTGPRLHIARVFFLTSTVQAKEWDLPESLSKS